MSATGRAYALVWALFAAGGCAAGRGDGPGTDGAAGDDEGDDTSDGDADADADSDHDAGLIGEVDADVCSEQTVEAAPAARPADIIWVIDNSGSMDGEESLVQSNLNDFSAAISDSGVDDHVILITSTEHVTIPPPLGGSDRYLAVNQEIDSNNALEQLIATYPQWHDFLRPFAAKHIVVVTDDESNMSQTEFETQMAALPEFADGFIFHAIVAEDPPWAFNSPCFLQAAAVGETYIDLQEAHDGVFYSLCQSDWTPVFEGLSASVVDHAALPCTYDIPPAPDGEEIDWNAVNFVYDPDDADPDPIPFVVDSDSCGAGPGWYYDDRGSPTQILVCPSTCDLLSSGTGNVNVAFGCATLLE